MVLEADQAGKEHGCQVIVSDVLDGIKWVLPLLDGTGGFVARYVELVRDDTDIRYAHKVTWNNAVRMTVRS